MTSAAVVEDYILTALSRDTERSPRALRRLKRHAGRRFGLNTISNDRLIARYRELSASGRLAPQPALEDLLRVNDVRSASGVATVTVLTKPFPCPGRCTYCPTEARVPKSYLSNEPAVRRAIRHAYDPYRQVRARLTTLANTGHPTDKIELIVKGGTWSAYPADYQRWFIHRCLDAANGADHQSLEQTQRANETAAQRIVGTTIETRPDWVTSDELIRLRRLGVTRVELGVQTLDDAILRNVRRGHDIEAVAAATRRLKDAGFKVAYHLMPGLPGATPEGDLATARRLFDDAAFRPDTLKLYPCVVVEEAELAEAWRRGAYRPYDEETLIALLVRLKPLVPPYVRIERIIRDIPTPSILAGCRAINLRQLLRERLQGQPWICRCIRCREPRRQAAPTALTLRRLDYDASSGREMFLSFEDEARDQLYAVLRLRLPGGPAATALSQATRWGQSPSGTDPTAATAHASPFPELDGAALIRELHTYGALVPINQQSDAAVQHRGLGRRLLAEAERIVAEESPLRRLAVIAGVGAREYYRRLGYDLVGTYMTKTISRRQIPVAGHQRDSDQKTENRRQKHLISAFCPLTSGNR